MYPTVVNTTARHALRDRRFNLMCSMDVNTKGSQNVHSICDTIDKIGLKMTNL